MRALKQRVGGYTHEESKTTYAYNGEGERFVKDEVLTRKTIGPDLAAIQFVLTNLNPARWNARAGAKEEGGAADLPAVDLSQLSQAALDELNGLCAE
jgi:hypothetical protein